jgi:hypothetical protein
MLDVQVYRQGEQQAITSLPKWQYRQRHNLDVFEKVGFPVRVDNIMQIRQIIDSMQEDRFDVFMHEIGGLTEQEFKLFLSACKRMVDFQLRFFPQSRPFIPLDVLMGAFCIYKKIKYLKPNFQNILEIGGGTGYLSLFLNSHEGLRNFSLVEVCESFYMLQSYINWFVYKDQFEQKALPPILDENSFFADLAPKGMRIGIASKIGRSLPLPSAAIQKRCVQYPWWKLGELYHNPIKFDVITSNANLLEMSLEALYDYLKLIRSKLKDDGIFFVQCFGYHQNGTINNLLLDMRSYGIVPMTYFQNGTFIPNQTKIDIQLDCDNVIIATENRLVLSCVSALKLEQSKKQIYYYGPTHKSRVPNPFRLLDTNTLEQFCLQNIGTCKAVIMHYNSNIIKEWCQRFDHLNVPYYVIYGKYIHLGNGVFITENHDKFDEFQKMTLQQVNQSHPQLLQCLYDKSEEKRTYSAEEIVEHMIKDLQLKN